MKRKLPVLFFAILICGVFTLIHPADKTRTTAANYTNGELTLWSSVLDQHLSAISDTDLQYPPYIEEITLLGYGGKNALYFMADQMINKIVFTFPPKTDLAEAANRISEECGEPSYTQTYEKNGVYLQWETQHTRFILATDGKIMTLTAVKY